MQRWPKIRTIGLSRELHSIQMTSQRRHNPKGRQRTMLDCAEITGRISEIVRQALPGDVPRALAADADLFEAGLTSMAMGKLILAGEVALDIAIPDADLTPGRFQA